MLYLYTCIYVWVALSFHLYIHAATDARNTGNDDTCAEDAITAKNEYSHHYVNVQCMYHLIYTCPCNIMMKYFSHIKSHPIAKPSWCVTYDTNYVSIVSGIIIYYM